MRPMTIIEVAAAIGAVEFPDLPGRPITGVSTDSRSTRSGDLFFALRGPHFDGHNFVARAIAMGAEAAVVEAGRADAVPEWCRNRLFVVGNARRALLSLAAGYRATLDALVIGVTGSCGKTTTKDLIHAILSRAMDGVASRGSFNNDVGVPLTLFEMDESHEYAVVEIGANAHGEIAELAAVAAPRVGVITCIRPVHLEGFGSVEGVAKAKSELVSALPKDGVFVYNPEEPWCFAIGILITNSASSIGLYTESSFWRRPFGTFTVTNLRSSIS